VTINKVRFIYGHLFYILYLIFQYHHPTMNYISKSYHSLPAWPGT